MAFMFMRWHLILCSAEGSSSTLLDGVFTSFWEGKMLPDFSELRGAAL